MIWMPAICLRQTSARSRHGPVQEKTIQMYGQALSLAEEASRMPECRFQTDWKDGFEALFPDYPALRKLAMLAAIRAILQARDGDMPGAAGSIELVVKMSYATKDDRVLINVFGRGAIIRMSVTALEAAVDYGQFSDAQARSLARAFCK